MKLSILKSTTQWEKKVHMLGGRELKLLARTRGVSEPASFVMDAR